MRKKATGRPRKYTKEYLAEIIEKLDHYIDETPIPVVAEFAYQNKIPRQALYRYEELSDTIKRLIDKKEAQLERLALKGEINQSMAIFSLKQLGWTDKLSQSIGVVPPREKVDINKMIEKAKQEVAEESSKKLATRG
ncbi:MAG: hypothetical protein WC961_08205 [Anaerovoracaceae bacterium]|jgi:hypothetical protein